MRIGFTGTRHGMSAEQKEVLIAMLIPEAVEPSAERHQLHHGDCIGADYEAAGIAYYNGFRVICHPPIDTTHRAYFGINAEDRKPKTHFARNRDIVDETDLLIACPQYMDPITKATKGGTAYTVNYARKCGKPVWIVRPDGSVEKEPGNHE